MNIKLKNLAIKARFLGSEHHEKMLRAEKDRSTVKTDKHTVAEYMSGYHYGMMTAYYEAATMLDQEAAKESK